MSSEVLLTGADGFVGRHVVSALARLGARVRRWTHGSRDRGEIQGDIRDPGLCAAAVAGVQAVVHCAGVINARDPAMFHSINVQGSDLLGRAAASTRVERFVFVSSSDVVFQPTGRYGASKAAAEAALSRLDLLDLRRIRPTVIYGPGDRKNVWAMIALARRCPLIYPLPAPGAGLRQPIWVEDLARALALMAVRPDGGPPLRHLAGPDSLSVRRMVEEILAALRLRRRIVALPVASGLGWIGRAGLSGLLVEHAEQLLSFEMDKAYRDEAGQWTADDGPRVTFAEGIRRWLDAEQMR